MKTGFVIVEYVITSGSTTCIVRDPKTQAILALTTLSDLSSVLVDIFK